MGYLKPIKSIADMQKAMDAQWGQPTVDAGKKLPPGAKPIGSLLYGGGFGTWSGGKQVPHQKVVLTGYDEKNGELIYHVDVYYGPKEQQEHHLNPVEHHWAYAAEVR